MCKIIKCPVKLLYLNICIEEIPSAKFNFVNSKILSCSSSGLQLRQIVIKGEERLLKSSTNIVSQCLLLLWLHDPEFLLRRVHLSVCGAKKSVDAKY